MLDDVVMDTGGVVMVMVMMVVVMVMGRRNGIQTVKPSHIL